MLSPISIRGISNKILRINKFIIIKILINSAINSKEV